MSTQLERAEITLLLESREEADVYLSAYAENRIIELCLGAGSFKCRIVATNMWMTEDVFAKRKNKKHVFLDLTVKPVR